MRVGYMLARKRYAHANVLEWALQKFPEYNGVEQVIKSCYDNTPGASRKASGGGGGGGGNGGSDNRFASVEEIRIFSMGISVSDTISSPSDTSSWKSQKAHHLPPLPTNRQNGRYSSTDTSTRSGPRCRSRRR